MLLSITVLKIGLTGTFLSLIVLVFGSLLDKVSNWYANFACIIFGLTLLSWIVFVLIIIWR